MTKKIYIYYHRKENWIGLILQQLGKMNQAQFKIEFEKKEIVSQITLMNETEELAFFESGNLLTDNLEQSEETGTSRDEIMWDHEG